jgi:hypothetical protein
MDVPISLHGNEYYEHLREYRDAALQESNWRGRRKRLGKFTFGIAHAQWHTEDDGLAYLTDEGLRYGSSTVWPVYPTKLHIIERIHTSHHITEFKMDVDDIGMIDVRTYALVDITMRELVKAEVAGWSERRHGLQEPSDDQRELLSVEMQRGASGMYGM